MDSMTSEDNFIAKEVKLPVDSSLKCSDNCYMTFSKTKIQTITKDFEKNGETMKFKIDKSGFFTFLLFTDHGDCVANFCEIAKLYCDKSYGEWFEFLCSKATGKKEKKEREKPILTPAAKRLNFITALEEDFSMKNIDFYMNNIHQCKHVGPCGPYNPQCDCIKMCSSLCKCDVNCVRRLPGCYCKPNECGTDKCLCVLMNRECVEGICRSCIASSDPEQPEWCKNNSLSRNAYKLIEVKKSTVAGDDVELFLKENAKKWDCIGHFKTKEVIVQKEVCCDIMDLCGTIRKEIMMEPDIDIVHVFSNGLQEYPQEYLNCKTSNNGNIMSRSIVVNGEIRTGVFALKDLDKGVELIFGSVHTRSKRRPLSEKKLPTSAKERIRQLRARELKVVLDTESESEMEVVLRNGRKYTKKRPMVKPIAADSDDDEGNGSSTSGTSHLARHNREVISRKQRSSRAAKKPKFGK